MIIPTTHHFIIELQSEVLTRYTERDCITLLDGICEELKLNVVQKCPYLFSPHGFSLVYVLAESHIALHFWPKEGYVHIDLLTCAPADPGIDTLSDFFAERHIRDSKLLKLKY